MTGSGPVGGATAGAGSGTAPRVVVVRPRRTSILAGIGAVIMVVVFTVIAVVLRNSPTGVYFRLADQVAMVLMGLLLAGGLLLLARPRVRADAEGIEVRNFGTARRLPWELVVRVAFPDGASWARLDLPDDEYLPVIALQAVDRGYAVRGITRLRELHAAAHR